MGYDYDKSQNDDPNTNAYVNRCPEDAVWNGIPSHDLVDMLYRIMEPYNDMLRSSPNLSDAYKEHGRLCREHSCAFGERVSV
jgi:hypothetical protein